MYTIEQLKQIRKQIEDEKDLPIEDIVDWDFVSALIESHIEANELIK